MSSIPTKLNPLSTSNLKEFDPLIANDIALYAIQVDFLNTDLIKQYIPFTAEVQGQCNFSRAYMNEDHDKLALGLIGDGNKFKQ